MWLLFAKNGPTHETEDIANTPAIQIKCQIH